MNVQQQPPPMAHQTVAMNEKAQVPMAVPMAPQVAPGVVMGAPAQDKLVLKTPRWMSVVRFFQLGIALVIMVMAGLLIHGVDLSELVFALACGIITWAVVGYSVGTEKMLGARSLYNHFVVMGLDGLMSIFWLASMGANAKLRASFKYDAPDVIGCYDDGSSIDAHTCITARELEKRNVIASPVALARMVVIAGLSALEFILFAVCLGYLIMLWRRTKPAAVPGGVEFGAAQPVAMQSVPVKAPAQFPTPAPAYQVAAVAPPMQPIQHQGTFPPPVVDAQTPYALIPVPDQMPVQQQSPVPGQMRQPVVQPQFSGQQYPQPPQQQQQVPYAVSPTGQYAAPPAQLYQPQPQEVPSNVPLQSLQQLP